MNYKYDIIQRTERRLALSSLIAAALRRQGFRDFCYLGAGLMMAAEHSQLFSPGDNSVLMQKVASEYLLSHRPSKTEAAVHLAVPVPLRRPRVSINQPRSIHSLLEAREKHLFTDLAIKMGRAGKVSPSATF